MTRKSRSVERDFLFQTIMEQIAIQGIAGCYHETAARGYFADREIEVLPCLSFDELFARMAADPALLGIAAIENTIAGSLLPNHELLQQSRARIIGEQKLRISHVLAALPGQTPDDIAEVRSHPIALMQCGDFLKTLPGMKIVERDDTAGSAREIAEGRLAGTAAICGADAARLYGLEILRLLFTLPHTRGSLSKVLTVLSFYDINLTKIQSLPIIGREWEYRFYVDVTFDDPMRYRQAIDAARPLTSDFRILGEYAECPNPAI